MRKITHIKTKFVVFFLLITSTFFANESAYFCGYYYNSDYYYFNLFNQENISQKAFYPFLKISEATFYSDITPEASENIRLWYAYFNEKYSKNKLAEIIFNEKNSNYTHVFGKGDKEAKVIDYLKFAKQCAVIALGKNSSWSYKEILKTKESNVTELLEKGLQLFESTKDKKLKIRYAYQIIRLYHYGKLYVDGIDFFENTIASSYPKDEMYYYILDQLGGCYYKTKKYEKAAYTFLTVFEHSYDRKQSALTSYKFCTYRGAEGKSFLKTSEEKANQIFITGLRNFSDSLEDLENINNLGAADDKQELLVMRLVNGIERSLFRHGRFNEEKLLKPDDDIELNILEILAFVNEKLKENPKNIEFWQLTGSYLSFLNGNTNEAIEKLNVIKPNRLKSQKENLAIIYQVFSWDGVSEENEIWLAKLFKNVKNIQVKDEGNCHEEVKGGKHNCNIHGFTFKQLSHYYFKENELAKAFLLHNYMEDIRGISSHELIDQLIAFVEKPTKNPFEKLLLKEQFERGFSTATIVNGLKKAKGNTYFRSGNFKEALPYLSESDPFDIKASVFSNNIKECFECDSFNVMTDEVYKAPVFSFLNKKMNTQSLSANLKKLEALATNEEEKTWKRKLAYYLLGNYFFNVSNTGYYRTVNYSGEYWYSYDFGYKRSTMDEMIESKEDYYFSTVYNSYNDLASKSKAYYNKTIALSTDDELNARCSYMIAKCELNKFYNTGTERYSYDSYEGDDYKKHAHEGFKALKTKYNKTAFYKDIKSKCSFFRYYDSQ